MISETQLAEELAYRQRLLDTLVKQDAKIRVLFEDDGVEREPSPEMDRMPLLVEYRDHLNLTKDEYETETKKVAGWMRLELDAAHLPKWESASHIVQIMNPPARVSFDEETAKTALVLSGVPIDKITAAFEKARKVTPVASFVRVDKRRTKK